LSEMKCDLPDSKYWPVKTLGEGETLMESQSRWVKREIQCPQDMRPSYLLVEYHMENGGNETLRSVSCDNPYLRDYGGGDCEWSCWEKISAEKG
jgi:hypothetical protein